MLRILIIFQVVHPTLNYVGYMDGLAVHLPSQKVILIDWKTSKKDKLTLAATFDAPIQIAAYAGQCGIFYYSYFT